MSIIRSLLPVSARQKQLCKRLKTNRGRLFRMAYAWSHNADIADETVQNTMISAMKNVDKLKDENAIDSWLFRILSNCFIDLCRQQRDEIDIETVPLCQEATPESVYDQNDMLSQVKQALSQLHLNHRQIITLVDIEEFSYAEVSRILDIPMGTVMSRLSRARNKLKQQLSESREKQKTRLEIVR